MEQAAIILVTGIMASGKSTVAQALAERLPRSVHLRGDRFRRMIVNGRAEMGLTLSPEAHAQLRLRYALAIDAAKRYRAAGFTVIYQDIVIGDALREVVAAFAGEKLHVVVLCPSAEVVARREAERTKQGYGPNFPVDAFDQTFRSETPRLGYWLDTSALSVAESVEVILAHLDEARVIP